MLFSGLVLSVFDICVVNDFHLLCLLLWLSGDSFLNIDYTHRLELLHITVLIVYFRSGLLKFNSRQFRPLIILTIEIQLIVSFSMLLRLSQLIVRLCSQWILCFTLLLSLSESHCLWLIVSDIIRRHR